MESVRELIKKEHKWSQFTTDKVFTSFLISWRTDKDFIAAIEG